jgi:hypothetical protein
MKYRRRTQASDIARMEVLLALSDIEANRTHDQSLSQMRSVLRELERSFRALEKSLVEAEGEDAWDFARVGADVAVAFAGGTTTQERPRRAHPASRTAHPHGRGVGRRANRKSKIPSGRRLTNRNWNPCLRIGGPGVAQLLEDGRENFVEPPDRLGLQFLPVIAWL